MDLSKNILGIRQAAPVLLLIAVVGIAYYPSLVTLWHKWTLWDQDLAHALPTIAVMLLLISRQTYTPCAAQNKSFSYWLLLVALSGSSLCWYLFESLDISLPAYLLILFSLALALACSFSLTTLKRLLPFLTLLIFTIPIWAELTHYLVEISARVVGTMVKLSKLTALLDGNSIFLPGGTIYIADGCSGLRYFTIAILMGYIITLINNYRLKQAIITLAIAAALGLIANWLRIYLLVLIGYYTDMQSSLMHDHETFGWILFAFIMMPAIYFAPINREKPAPIPLPSQRIWVPLLALFPGPLLLLAMSQQSLEPQPLSLAHLKKFQNTTSQASALVEPRINNHSAATIKLDPLTLRIDLFTHQPQQAREEIVPYIGSIMDLSQWRELNKVTVDAALKGKVDIRIYRNTGGERRLLVAKEFIVGKIRTDSYLIAKLAQIPARLGNNNYFGLWTAQIYCSKECAEEVDQLNQLLPQIRVPSED